MIRDDNDHGNRNDVLVPVSCKYLLSEILASYRREQQKYDDKEEPKPRVSTLARKQFVRDFYRSKISFRGIHIPILKQFDHTIKTMLDAKHRAALILLCSQTCISVLWEEARKACIKDADHEEVMMYSVNEIEAMEESLDRGTSIDIDFDSRNKDVFYFTAKIPFKHVSWKGEKGAIDTIGHIQTQVTLDVLKDQDPFLDDNTTAWIEVTEKKTL